METVNVYQMVTDRIIEELQKVSFLGTSLGRVQVSQTEAQ